MLVAAVVSLAACSKGATNLAAGSACTSSDACATNLVCDSGQCRVACNLTSDCPAGDRCIVGLCSPLPNNSLAAQCIRNDDCESGHCVDGICCDSACNGVCQQCNANTGRCEKPDDDDTCGAIVCSGLSNACRTYSDLGPATQHRCAAFGRCARPNDPTDCAVYDDVLSEGAVCRYGLNPTCDPQAICMSGMCVNFTLVPGDHCMGTTGDDIGVCDNELACLQLPTVGIVSRYFLEEPNLTDNRVDAFNRWNLVATYTNDVFAETGAAGRGVRWGSSSATSTYCSSQFSLWPVGPITSVIEVDFTLDTTRNYSDEWIAGFTSDTNMFGLSLSYAIATKAATLTGYYTIRDAVNGNKTYTVSYVFVPGSAHVVVHLVYDSRPSDPPTDRLVLFVNGTAVQLPPTSVMPGFINWLETSNTRFCVGNTPDGLHAAFTGTIWYAAVYSGTRPTPDQISAAVERLMVSDAP